MHHYRQHYRQHYNKIYTFIGNYNGRPIYKYLSQFTGDLHQFYKAFIKWDEFKFGEFDQMAWIIMGSDEYGTRIRFVSFSDVNDPRLAEDWKYINNEMQLIDAPDLYLA